MSDTETLSWSVLMGLFADDGVLIRDADIRVNDGNILHAFVFKAILQHFKAAYRQNDYTERDGDIWFLLPYESWAENYEMTVPKLKRIVNEIANRKLLKKRIMLVEGVTYLHLTLDENAYRQRLAQVLLQPRKE